jgi:hypothetical protein
MRKPICLAVVVAILPFVAFAANFPDAREKPPAGWNGPVFRLSQDYPGKLPAAEKLPWKAFDFATQPEQYMAAVYAYALEGNIETEFRGRDNPVRKWYHAPWMHYGNNGREFIRGVTRERNSRPKDLAPTQNCYWQNWAVGLYNPPGGYVTGQVWKNPEKPDASKADFPDGTVSVKLLFTVAPVSQVPYLVNGFKWQANIDPVGGGKCTEKDPSGTRTPQEITLLQIDLAVRETRADGYTGWVMGTLVYDGNAPGATAWERMVPVGLQWGNDPLLTPERHAAGERVKESWINPKLKIPQHLGWLGRLNGPVDNPMSACLSCHGTAQDPAHPDVPPAGSTDAERMRWFRNVKWNEPFAADDPRNPKTLGYSLQLAKGIENKLLASGEIVADMVNGQVVMRMKNSGQEVAPISREEGLSQSELMAMGLAAVPKSAANAATDEPPASVRQTSPWLGYGLAGLIGLIVGAVVTLVAVRSRG